MATDWERRYDSCFWKIWTGSHRFTEIQGCNGLEPRRCGFIEPTTLFDAIRNYAPQAVINAAAYTAVDEAEKDEHTATIINGIYGDGQGCAELGIPLVHISTDYVFDGTGDTP